MSSRKDEKEQRKAERLELERQQAQAAARSRRMQFGLGGLGVVAVIGAIVAISAGGGGGGGGAIKSADHGGKPILKTGPLSALGKLVPAPTGSTIGPEGVMVPSGPLLATSTTGGGGNNVDGISCLSNEQLQFHIHAHLTIFINGKARQLPAGVGITSPQVQLSQQGPFIGGGNCFYWLHVHALDGIIHIESPEQRTYTLGDFFDIWGQALSPTQIASEKGRVVAIYNGQQYLGNPRNIPLNSHAQIQLEIGSPLVAPVTTSFPNGL